MTKERTGMLKGFTATEEMIKGDVAGHEFHGNQFSTGYAGGKGAANNYQPPAAGSKDAKEKVGTQTYKGKTTDITRESRAQAAGEHANQYSATGRSDYKEGPKGDAAFHEQAADWHSIAAEHYAEYGDKAKMEEHAGKVREHAEAYTRVTGKTFRISSGSNA